MTAKKIAIDITANDEASSKLDHVADRVEALDGTSVEVPIDADDHASGDLDKVNDEVQALDGEVATVKVDADVSGAESGIAGIREQIAGLDGPIGKLASPGGAVLAIGAGFLAAADHAADLAIEADNLARLTGDTVEEASQLSAVWKTTGADVGDLTDILLNMTSVLRDDAALAAQLGVNLDDGATGGERFQQVLDILKMIPDATERAMLASTLFGEEGVRQVNLLQGAYEDLGAAMDSMPTLSAKDAEAARENKAALSELNVEWQKLVVTVGEFAIPVLSFAIQSLTGLPQLGTDIGRSLRTAFDPQAAKNWGVVEALNDAEVAARDFDRAQLDGLTTFDQVHAKVLEATGSTHAANLVATEWKRSQDALKPSLDGVTDSVEKQDRAVINTIESTRAYVDELDAAVRKGVEFGASINDASADLRDLAAAQDGIEAGKLAAALDVGDEAIDTLNSIQQINAGIRDLATFIQTEGVPNIFDPDDVDAAQFLSKISSLKGPIQEQVSQAFGESGPGAAQAVAESFVQSLAQQTGITPDKIRTLLGLDDLTINLKIAIEQTEVDKARTQLALLTGLTGDTPLSASLALALDAGTITGQQAQTLIQEQLRGKGVTIPTVLAAPDTDKALADAQQAFNARQPVTIPTNLHNQTGSATPQVAYNTIINPPGTPAATYDQFNQHLAHNGSRTNQ